MRVTRTRAAIGLAAVAAAAAGGIATSAGGSPAASGSRLDDGKQYLPKAKVTEQQAIAAAQRAESGDLNEVDLEYHDGRLVWNVDVGSKDVKVDAETGQVVGSTTD